MQGLEQALKARQEELARLAAQLQQASSSRSSETLASWTSLQADLANAQQQVESLKARCSRSEEASAQASELRAANEGLRAEVARLKAAAEAAEEAHRKALLELEKWRLDGRLWDEERRQWGTRAQAQRETLVSSTRAEVDAVTVRLQQKQAAAAKQARDREEAARALGQLVEQLEGEVASRDARLAKQELEVERWRKRGGALEERAGALAGQLASRAEEAEGLRAEVAELGLRLAAEGDRNQLLQQELTALHAQVSALEEREVRESGLLASSQLSFRNVQAEQSVVVQPSERQMRLFDFEEQLEARESELQLLRAQAAGLESRLRAQQASSAKLAEENSGLRRQLEDAAQRAAEAEQALSAGRTREDELGSTVSTLQAQLRERARQLEQQSAEAEALRAQARQSVEQLRVFHEQLAVSRSSTVQSTSRSTTVVNFDMEEPLRQLDRATAESRAAKLEAEALRLRLKRAEEAVAALEAAGGADRLRLEKLSTALEEKGALVKGLERDATALRAEAEALKVKLRCGLQSAGDQLQVVDALKKDVEGLRLQLAEQRSVAAELAVQLDRSRAEAAEAAQRDRAFRSRQDWVLASLREALERSARDEGLRAAEQLNRQLQELRAQGEALQRSLDGKAREAADLERRLRTAESRALELGKAEDRLALLGPENESLKTQLRSSNAAADSLNATLAELEKEVRKLRLETPSRRPTWRARGPSSAGRRRRRPRQLLTPRLRPRTCGDGCRSCSRTGTPGSASQSRKWLG